MNADDNVLTLHVNLVVKLQVVLARIRSSCVENNVYPFKGWVYKRNQQC
jgi:hypothetical protein